MEPSRSASAEGPGFRARLRGRGQGHEAEADLAHLGGELVEGAGQQPLARPLPRVAAAAEEIQDQARPVRVGKPGAEGFEPPPGLPADEHGLRPELLEVEGTEREVQLTDLPLRQPLVRDLDDLLVEHGVHAGGAIVAPHFQRPRHPAPASGPGDTARGSSISFVADAQGLEPRRRVGGQILAGHRVEARAPSVFARVRDEVAHARLEVLGRAERAPAGHGDGVPHRVGDEATAFRDEQVVLVRPQREGGQRTPRVGAPDALHVLGRRFQAVAKDDRAQQQHEHVEPRHPARDLERTQEARGLYVERAQLLRRDEEAAADGLRERVVPGGHWKWGSSVRRPRYP